MVVKPTKYVSELEPYKVSESAKLAIDEKLKFLKLDWNEATTPPSPKVSEMVMELVRAGVFNFYPDVTAKELCAKLSLYVGIDISSIQVFNGSDSAISTICDTYIEPDDRVLIREPVYTQPYTFIQSRGGKMVHFTGQDPFSKALDEYNKYLSGQHIRLVYIANPNNPTGVLYDISEVEQLLQAYPQTLFIIDEAYFEYAGKTVVDLTKQNHNLIVTRTFSKAFGLAGLRIGYTISSPQIKEEISKIRNGKDVNIMAQIAACAALDDIPYMEEQVKKLIKTREWLVKNLRSSGLKTRETPANFILIRVAKVAEVIKRLRNEQILVRDRSYMPQLDGYIRVSIGTQEEMEMFLKAFSRLPEGILK